MIEPKEALSKGQAMTMSGTVVNGHCHDLKASQAAGRHGSHQSRSVVQFADSVVSTSRETKAVPADRGDAKGGGGARGCRYASQNLWEGYEKRSPSCRAFRRTVRDSFFGRFVVLVTSGRLSRRQAHPSKLCSRPHFRGLLQKHQYLNCRLRNGDKGRLMEISILQKSPRQGKQLPLTIRGQKLISFCNGLRRPR
jgi:hypothetical protein